MLYARKYFNEIFFLVLRRKTRQTGSILYSAVCVTKYNNNMAVAFANLISRQHENSKEVSFRIDITECDSGFLRTIGEEIILFSVQPHTSFKKKCNTNASCHSQFS